MPFSVNPDPAWIYGSEVHQEALAVLKYAVIDKKGFLLLTGDVGTGKTMLIQRMSRILKERVHLCMLTNPKLSLDDFFYYLCRTYELEEYTGNKSKFLFDFADFLKKCKERDEQVLLIIDEAHVLPLDLLEEIRLLSNQGHELTGVLTIFLVGQPEVHDLLADERLLPLRQRIAIKFHLLPFSLSDTRGYILFRLQKAGAIMPKFFSEDAFGLIHEKGKGIPRLINIICDHALLQGFSEGKKIISKGVVVNCLKDINIIDKNNSKQEIPRHGIFSSLKSFFPKQVILVVCVLLLAVALTISLEHSGLFSLLFEFIHPFILNTK
jgi:general secretion pathway protein A